MASRLPFAVLAVACVPEGPATDREVTLPEQTIVVAATGDVLREPFRDDFDREEIGEDYEVLSDAWALKDGWLCTQNARNRGAWLKKRLPVDVRIELDAIALSEEGDIKVELFGDGESGASGISYDDATGYIAIFGGWRNQLHVLARLDEHDPARQSRAIDPQSDDPVTRPVQVGQSYHFKFERRHGNMLVMSVDGNVVLEHEDKKPLKGPGHEHFAFNGWTAPVCFDNLEILPSGT